MEVDVYVLEKINPEKCTNQLLNNVFGSISAFFEDFPLIKVIISDRCFLSENIVENTAYD